MILLTNRSHVPALADAIWDSSRVPSYTECNWCPHQGACSPLADENQLGWLMYLRDFIGRST